MSGEFSLLAKAVILTEGETDRWILQRSLGILYPHLAEYFHFLELDGAKVEGGAGQLANLVKALAGAGIKNKIIALFDNDTAADSALRSLSTATLPENIVVLKYPAIALGEDYPTLGPSGVSSMNVNGLAASIELYLGKEVLEDARGTLTPVQWKGYDPKLKKYQGEITNKAVLQDRFMRKLAACEANPSLVPQYDWEGIRSILNTIRTAFNSS